MGFRRQEYWSDLPLASPGDLHDPGIELTSPVLQADFLLQSHQGSLEARNTYMLIYDKSKGCICPSKGNRKTGISPTAKLWSLSAHYERSWVSKK